MASGKTKEASNRWSPILIPNTGAYKFQFSEDKPLNSRPPYV